MFPVTLRLEGTVRGTGGLRIVDDQCATSVPGLYAAGDAATRELICGGFTGGGSHNAAWALSSGFWAGAGAAQFAQGNRLANSTHLRGQGGAGLVDARGQQLDPGKLITAVQEEVFPYQRNWFRHGDELQASLGRLDTLWQQVREAAPASGSEQTLRLREATSMLAVSRWMYRSALKRTESRGMHRRTDYAGIDSAQRHRVISGGLDDVWTSHERLGPVDEQLLTGQAA
jgi:succinate dehydrogenase/fumarate reductase flavoprotein subunit